MALATLPHDEVLDPPKVVAAELNCAEATLADWRVRGFGPPWLKLGKSVLYPRSQRMEWLAARIRKSTSDHGQRAA